MTHIQQRRDTFANWTLINPILMEGEAGHETNTGRWKLGDGVTAYVDLPYKAGVDSVAGKTGAVALVVADVAGAAPLADPALTGAPTAPTPALSSNTTRLATTEWVKSQAYAVKDSPAFLGNPTAPTPAAGDNDTSLATTAFVKGAVDTAVSAALATIVTRKVVLSRYSNRASLIAFGGFPANGTRYDAPQWGGLVVPAGAEYVQIHGTLSANAAGNAAIQYWLAASVQGGAYADVGYAEEYNNGTTGLDLSANVSACVTIPAGTTTLAVKIAGAAVGVGVSTYYANINVSFIGKAP